MFGFGKKKQKIPQSDPGAQPPPGSAPAAASRPEPATTSAMPTAALSAPVPATPTATDTANPATDRHESRTAADAARTSAPQAVGDDPPLPFAPAPKKPWFGKLFRFGAKSAPETAATSPSPAPAAPAAAPSPPLSVAAQTRAPLAPIPPDARPEADTAPVPPAATPAPTAIAKTAAPRISPEPAPDAAPGHRPLADDRTPEPRRTARQPAAAQRPAATADAPGVPSPHPAGAAGTGQSKPGEIQRPPYPQPPSAARGSERSPDTETATAEGAKAGLFSRLRERLSRTRSQLGDGLGQLFIGRKRIDDDLLEELETLLITADVGVNTTARIVEDLTARVKRRALADPQALQAALKQHLREILLAADGPVRQPEPGRPQVILMVGVNGAGKTTTIGKLARRLQAEGNSVMLAAGDTFRAAAVEQLAVWGERNRIPVIAQQSGADSASVIFDALQAATARGIDVLIADTAGRLHTKSNLMDELAKVARVLRKLDPDAPHEVMLVVDASTGQNALNQARHFHQAVGLTGIALTKLDGTARGGILFAIADELRVPIRFIGVGERIEDLRPFDADDFVDALLG